MHISIIHIRTHLFELACLYLCLRDKFYVSICVFSMYVRVHKCMYVLIYINNIEFFIYLYLCYNYICVCVNDFTNIRVCMCLNTYIFVYVCMDINMNVYLIVRAFA